MYTAKKTSQSVSHFSSQAVHLNVDQSISQSERVIYQSCISQSSPRLVL